MLAQPQAHMTDPQTQSAGHLVEISTNDSSQNGRGFHDQNEIPVNQRLGLE